MKEDIIGNLKKHQILLLTILSGIMGVVIFICIYGLQVLNVTKDAWLNSSGDLTQHYYGWVFFRDSAWTFPIGLFNTLSYPNYSSIIFTDSIPLFAIFFKALSVILPDTFQYFGLFGIICYMLQGIFAFTLLRKFINNKFYTIIGTVFFIISPYILQRMFAHTGLSANFLILAGFCLFAYRNKYKDKPKKKIILWTLLLVVSTTIHLYYIPMIVIIMICTFISEFIEDKKTCKISIITFIVASICSILVIYIFGGFTNSSTYSNGGLGYFNVNLNTFFNPQGYSSFLKDLNIATTGEYEAMGYLGLGILLMCFLSVFLIIQKYNKKEFIELVKRPNTIFVILCIVRSSYSCNGG